MSLRSLLSVGGVVALAVSASLTMAAAPPASAASPASAATVTVRPTDHNIKYFGRWDTSSATGYVPDWAGAYAVVGFTGRTVELNQRGSVDLYASIDNGAFKSYPNVSGVLNLTSSPLASGTHTLRVSYRPVEGSYHGDNVFQGVLLASGAQTVTPPVPSKIIEFIGDSITVGYRSSQEALTSYGWLTGEQLGAGHTQIARSGACLYPAERVHRHARPVAAHRGRLERTGLGLLPLPGQRRRDQPGHQRSRSSP